MCNVYKSARTYLYRYLDLISIPVIAFVLRGSRAARVGRQALHQTRAQGGPEGHQGLGLQRFLW